MCDKEHIEKQCPGCGQRLRIPSRIGGMLMKCPSCGKNFHTDFKLNHQPSPPAKKTRKNPLVLLFELPTMLISYLRRFFSSKN
ncbi:MAG: hypothetical protein CSB24_02385 [Deltaproteobacteria bacterium]|nr:MAG: hypothetical protein CSB24_02385 [Deltaproteobacteria bacterium]